MRQQTLWARPKLFYQRVEVTQNYGEVHKHMNVKRKYWVIYSSNPFSKYAKARLPLPQGINGDPQEEQNREFTDLVLSQEEGKIDLKRFYTIWIHQFAI